MRDATLVILLHQLLFQGMFFAKNITLQRKLERPVRGANPEASLAIGFFVIFIALSLLLAQTGSSWGRFALLSAPAALALGLFLLGLTLLVAAASLQGLGDSWRVGVIEEQQTALVESGIYRYSRNPYFLAYLLMFAAYTVLLQSALLLGLSAIGFILVHAMVLREEKHLAKLHPQAYREYCQRVPRYLIRQATGTP
jgi:protein-S-isoprenylcysteine O-methyltransferase Ste14